MPKFEVELPNDLIKEFENLSKDSKKMVEDMTKAGAKVIYDNMNKNLPQALKESGFKNNIKLTRTYETLSDGGINTGVAITGYFINKEGKKTPAPLVANVFEYGTSRSGRDYPQQPFLRKSVKKEQIEAAMLKVQDEYIKG